MQIIIIQWGFQPALLCKLFVRRVSTQAQYQTAKGIKPVLSQDTNPSWFSNGTLSDGWDGHIQWMNVVFIFLEGISSTSLSRPNPFWISRQHSPLQCSAYATESRSESLNVCTHPGLKFALAPFESPIPRAIALVIAPSRRDLAHSKSLAFDRMLFEFSGLELK